MTDEPIDTLLATLGRERRFTGGLVNTPVMRASTVLFETYAQLRSGVRSAFGTDTPFYGRMGTPSQWSLRDALTALEEGAGTHLYPSGIAAIAASLLALTEAGDHVLLPDSAYEPVRGIARHLLSPKGIAVDYYDPMIGAGIVDKMHESTRLILVESPGSLTFEVQDLPAIVAAAKAHHAYVVVDNTWGTPLHHQPLLLGADISVNACTKYIVGHSDVMMGAATANDRTWKKLDQVSRMLGQTVSPDDAFLTLRGLRTLKLRLEAHAEKALKIANWLAEQDEVDQVLHPALPSCPGHDIWKRDFTGANGLFAITLKWGAEADVAPMVDGMTHFKMGFSWGGYESLILPANPAPIRTATRWGADGPLLRLHIGLEDESALIEDLAAGLARYRAHIEAQS